MKNFLNEQYQVKYPYPKIDIHAILKDGVYEHRLNDLFHRIGHKGDLSHEKFIQKMIKKSKKIKRL